MEVGFYTRHPFDFNKLRVPRFQINLGSGWSHGHGCGANALSMITGISPDDTARIVSKKRYGHFDDKNMVAFLKKNDYQVVPLTQCLVSQQGWATHVKPDHVILMSQLLAKNEGSWTVTYRGKVYHNFGENDIEPMEFINRPVLSAYLIFHPKWK